MGSLLCKKPRLKSFSRPRTIAIRPFLAVSAHTDFPSPTRYRFPTSKSMKIASPSRAHLGATSFRFSSGQGPPATRPCPHITLPVGVRGGAGYRWKALVEPVVDSLKSREDSQKKNFGGDACALARRREAGAKNAAHNAGRSKRLVDASVVMAAAAHGPRAQPCCCGRIFSRRRHSTFCNGTAALLCLDNPLDLPRRVWHPWFDGVDTICKHFTRVYERDGAACARVRRVVWAPI